MAPAMRCRRRASSVALSSRSRTATSPRRAMRCATCTAPGRSTWPRRACSCAPSAVPAPGTKCCASPRSFPSATIAPALAEEYKVQATVELLARSADDAGALERRWRGIPAADRVQPRIAAAGARTPPRSAGRPRARHSGERACRRMGAPARRALRRAPAPLPRKRKSARPVRASSAAALAPRAQPRRAATRRARPAVRARPSSGARRAASWRRASRSRKAAPRASSSRASPSARRGREAQRHFRKAANCS